MGILTSVEQRSTLKNPAGWLEEALAGDMTPSGVRVTPEKAQGLTAWWNGVHVISTSIASLPIDVFERADKERRPRRETRQWRILNQRPNPLMTPFVFKELRIVHLLTWGNSYCEIQRDNAGRPVALWPLLPDRTGVELVNGRKKYWTVVNNRKVWLDADLVLHVPGKGFDGIQGHNPVKVHRRALGLSIAADEYGSRFFGQGARVSGMLVHPGKPQKEERQEIRESWNQVHQGLSNAQRTALLWGGMKFEQLSMPPNDAQFLETRSNQIDEVARILNINPILLQKTQGVTTWGTAIGQFLTAYTKFTIQPWLERDEDALNWDLFAGNQRGKLYVKYNADALLRGDPKAQAELLEVKRRNGVINADEWRALDDEDPLPDGQGQVYTIPVNTMDLADLTAPALPPVPEPVPGEEGPDDPPPALEPEAEPAAEDVQHSALNGAQISSLLLVLTQISQGVLAPDAAKIALKVSFPSLTDEQIAEMVDAAEAHDPPETEQELLSRFRIRKVRAVEQREKRSNHTAAHARLRRAHRAAIEDGARRALRRETQALERAIKRAEETEDPAASLNRWIESFYPGQHDAIKKALGPAILAYSSAVALAAAAEVDADPPDDEAIEEFSDGITEGVAQREVNASVGQLREIIAGAAVAEVADQVRKRAGEWSETRPGKTADAETVRIQTGATRNTWQNAGVTRMVWIANADACPICQDMDGRTASISGYFLDEGDQVNPSGDTAPLRTTTVIVAPPLHQGCQCDIGPE